MQAAMHPRGSRWPRILVGVAALVTIAGALAGAYALGRGSERSVSSTEPSEAVAGSRGTAGENDHVLKATIVPSASSIAQLSDFAMAHEGDTVRLDLTFVGG